MKKKIKKILKSKLFKQIIRFGIVGGTSFILEFLIFAFFNDVLHIHYLLSSILSFSIAVIYNYILNVKWVFNAKKQTPKEFIIFMILSIIGLGINSLIMYISVDFINLDAKLSKVIATGIVMVYNFITRKIFIEVKEK